MILLVSFCLGASFAQDSTKEKSIYVFKVPNLTVDEYSTLKQLEQYEEYRFINVCIHTGMFAVECDIGYEEYVETVLKTLIGENRISKMHLETIATMEEKCNKK